MATAFGHLKFTASHKYETEFSVFEVRSVEDHVQRMVFKSKCDKSGSWEIWVKFSKRAPFDKFNLYVTFKKRTDHPDPSVDGYVVVWLKNQEGKICPASYHVKCLLNGRESEEHSFDVDPHFNCLLREEDHVTLPDDLLIVKVELFVRGCCNNVIGDQSETTKFTEKEDSNEKLQCCSKL